MEVHVAQFAHDHIQSNQSFFLRDESSEWEASPGLAHARIFCIPGCVYIMCKGHALP